MSEFVPKNQDLEPLDDKALEEEIRGEFLHIVSHQFRTPLTGLKWALEMVLNEYAHEVSETVRDLLSEAKRKNDFLMNLLDRLIVVGQVERGELSFNWSLGDLDRVLAEIIGNHKERAQQKTITLHYQRPDGPLPVVRLDMEKISMVLDNLLYNAIKFTPTGGGIYLNVRQEGNQVVVIVRDTGIGVPADQSSLLFSKFFWARNVALHQHDGLGVGLYICRAIVEAHGGKIEAQSQEGKGSEFRICLPVLNNLSHLE